MIFEDPADWAERRDERDEDEGRVEFFTEERESITAFSEDLEEWLDVWFFEFGYPEIYKAAMALRLLLQNELENNAVKLSEARRKVEEKRGKLYGTN